MVYTANWGIICHLPPFKGTWKIHWYIQISSYHLLTSTYNTFALYNIWAKDLINSTDLKCQAANLTKRLNDPCTVTGTIDQPKHIYNLEDKILSWPPYASRISWHSIRSPSFPQSLLKQLESIQPYTSITNHIHAETNCWSISPKKLVKLMLNYIHYKNYRSLSHFF